MTNINKAANLAKSAAAKTMSAASFNKITAKAGNSGYGKNPEKLTGAMDSMASQNKADILGKMRLIQQLRANGINTKGIDKKTLDNIQNETKILEKTASPTSAPLLDAAKKFLKDPYNTAHTAAKRLKLKNYIRIPKDSENRVF